MFALNAALNETQRAIQHESAGEDQEVAAAVLWNDSAGSEAWGRAWAACADSEGFAPSVRQSSPQTIVAGFVVDAGAVPASDSSGASDADLSDARTVAEGVLRGSADH